MQIWRDDLDNFGDRIQIAGMDKDGEVDIIVYWRAIAVVNKAYIIFTLLALGCIFGFILALFLII